MFISHKTEEIFEISDDVCIMRNGKNVFAGPTNELTREDFNYYLTGRKLHNVKFEPKSLSEDPILEVRNLSLKNKYNDINFSLHKGEIFGITGLLGSGRTELALSLLD